MTQHSRKILSILDYSLKLVGCSFLRNGKYLDARLPSISFFLLAISLVTSSNEYLRNTKSSNFLSTKERMLYLVTGFSSCMVLFYRIKNGRYFEKLEDLHDEICSLLLEAKQNKKYRRVLKIILIYTGICLVLAFKMCWFFQNWKSRKLIFITDFVSTFIIYFESITLGTIISFINNAVLQISKTIDYVIQLSNSLPVHQIKKTENADLIIIEWTKGALKAEKNIDTVQAMDSIITCSCILSDYLDIFSKSFGVTQKFCYGVFIIMMCQQISLFLRRKSYYDVSLADYGSSLFFITLLVS